MLSSRTYSYSPISPAQDAGLQHFIIWGLLFSIIVHFALYQLFSTRSAPVMLEPIFVDITMPPIVDIPTKKNSEAPRKQIVSPPESQAESKSLKDTNLLSDRDTSADREQIKRGDPLAGAVINKKMGPPIPGANEQLPPQPMQQPAQEAKSRSQLQKANLTLDSKTVLNDFSLPQESAKPKSDDSAVSLNNSNYKPFSRPSGSGAAFLGSRGSNDYLPSLPDGDITLMNTKANKFAVFVRRVATQVFAQLRTAGWDVLRGAEINSAQSSTLVRAVMSPKGEVLRITLEASSGSSRFDAVVQGAARSGAQDPNPPEGAFASDGNVHFIFEARSWSEMFAGGKSGMPVERRWLMLGTGLE